MAELLACSAWYCSKYCWKARPSSERARLPFGARRPGARSMMSVLTSWSKSLASISVLSVCFRQSSSNVTYQNALTNLPSSWLKGFFGPYMALVLHKVTICLIQAKRLTTPPRFSVCRYVEASRSITLVILSRPMPGARLATAPS